jgi:hypothetical protein
VIPAGSCRTGHRAPPASSSCRADSAAIVAETRVRDQVRADTAVHCLLALRNFGSREQRCRAHRASRCRRSARFAWRGARTISRRQGEACAVSA